MRFDRAVLFIIVTVFLDTVGFGIILPVTPDLIRELTGLGLSEASRYGGWLAFTYALMQFVCAPILGGLSDRFGRRPVLLLSLFALGVDYLIMGFAPTLAWLFVGRTLAGMAGASFTTAYAFLADVSPPEKRAQNFGLVGGAFGLGFIAGPAIGGLLPAFGPRAPFFASAAVAGINLCFGLFVLPESLRPELRRPFAWARANPVGTLVQLARHPVVLGLSLVVFLWQLGHQVLPSVWNFYTMLKFQWSQAAVGYSLAYAGLVMAIGQGALTRVLIPWLGGQRRAAFLGLLGGAFIYFGYAFSSESWMLYACMTFWFLAAVAYPSLNAIMSARVPPNAQGELQGGLASLMSLSAIVGPPVMTQVFAHYSGAQAEFVFPGAPFFAAGLLALGSVMLYVISLRATDRPG